MGLLMVLVGIGLIVLRSRKLFYRTNHSGVEVHRSFVNMIVTKLVDFAVGWGAIILIIWGLLIFFRFPF